jgi:signal recognition particle receptor subunit beta
MSLHGLGFEAALSPEELAGAQADPVEVPSYKLVVAGPVGAGKTTFVQAISSVGVLETDETLSLPGRSNGRFVGDDKRVTTVGIDFGRIELGAEAMLYLFGTPGQRRFDYMWEIAARGMLGFLLVFESGRPEAWQEAREVLTAFRALAPVPFAVAVNKGGDWDRDRAEAVQALGLDDDDLVLPVDARDRDSVKTVLVAFLERMLDLLEAAA